MFLPADESAFAGKTNLIQELQENVIPAGEEQDMKYKQLKKLGITAAISVTAAGASLYGGRVTAQAGEAALPHSTGLMSMAQEEEPASIEEAEAQLKENLEKEEEARKEAAQAEEEAARAKQEEQQARQAAEEAEAARQTAEEEAGKAMENVKEEARKENSAAEQNLTEAQEHLQQVTDAQGQTEEEPQQGQESQEEEVSEEEKQNRQKRKNRAAERSLEVEKDLDASNKELKEAENRLAECQTQEAATEEIAKKREAEAETAEQETDEAERQAAKARLDLEKAIDDSGRGQEIRTSEEYLAYEKAEAALQEAQEQKDKTDKEVIKARYIQKKHEVDLKLTLDINDHLAGAVVLFYKYEPWYGEMEQELNSYFTKLSIQIGGYAKEASNATRLLDQTEKELKAADKELKNLLVQQESAAQYTEDLEAEVAEAKANLLYLIETAGNSTETAEAERQVADLEAVLQEVKSQALTSASSVIEKTADLEKKRNNYREARDTYINAWSRYIWPEIDTVHETELYNEAMERINTGYNNPGSYDHNDEPNMGDAAMIRDELEYMQEKTRQAGIAADAAETVLKKAVENFKQSAAALASFAGDEKIADSVNTAAGKYLTLTEKRDDQRKSQSVLLEAQESVGLAEKETEAAGRYLTRVTYTNRDIQNVVEDMQAEAEKDMEKYSVLYAGEYLSLSSYDTVACHEIYVADHLGADPRLEDLLSDLSNVQVTDAREDVITASQIRDSRSLIQKAAEAMTLEGLLNAAEDDALYKDFMPYAETVRQAQASAKEAEALLEEKTRAASQAAAANEAAKKALEDAAAELAESIKTYGAMLQIPYNDDPVWADGDGDLLVGANGNYEWFTGALIDGNAADPSGYSSYAGSTYIILDDNYLAGLAKGRHSLTFDYLYGSASTTLRIEEKRETEQSSVLPTDNTSVTDPTASAGTDVGHSGSSGISAAQEADFSAPRAGRSAADYKAGSADGRKGGASLSHKGRTASAKTGDPGSALPAAGLLTSLAGLLTILKRRKRIGG